jgi:hypothetical protein
MITHASKMTPSGKCACANSFEQMSLAIGLCFGMNAEQHIYCSSHISEIHCYIVKSNNLSTIFAVLYKKYNAMATLT